jgi:hypothetical protein
LELFGIGEHHGNAISSLTQFTDELRSTVKERIDYIGAGVIPSSDRGGNLEPMTKEGQLLELRQHLAESFLAKDSPNKHNFEITPEVMGSLHEITSKFVGGHEELHTLVGLNVHLFKMSEEFDPKAPNVKFGN